MSRVCITPVSDLSFLLIETAKRADVMERK